MRGKVAHSPVRAEGVGITPAYAGKSRWKNTAALSSRDHPRICGEKLYDRFGKPRRLGSPPHMRGKALSVLHRALLCRITPAYAGKSSMPFSPPPDGRDHPRICGEKASLMWPKGPHRGSPPHMRGKVTGRVDTADANRITPAYAGKSVYAIAHRDEIADHPRICGEKHKRTVAQHHL